MTTAPPTLRPVGLHSFANALSRVWAAAETDESDHLGRLRVQAPLQRLFVLLRGAPAEPIARDAVEEAADARLLLGGGCLQTALEVRVEALAVDFGLAHALQRSAMARAEQGDRRRRHCAAAPSRNSL
jgi:hypothetical protein